jgi:septal ring factor EnvC (AmiA/AmiB activator)
LLDVANSITTQITGTVRHEVGLAREQFKEDLRAVHARIGDVQRAQHDDRSKLAAHANTIAAHEQQHDDTERRLTDVEADCGGLGQEVARLDERTRNVQPMLGLSLSKSQKTMLGAILAAAGTGLLDLARHAITAAFAYLQHRPPAQP